MNSSNFVKRKMPFSSLICDFGPKVYFSTSRSKRFEILPFSSGLLTHLFVSVKSGVFLSFLLNLVFLTLCTSI
ncbi:hypothetical protein Hanom_Chr02g00115091 [Helianthus anomalus]